MKSVTFLILVALLGTGCAATRSTPEPVAAVVDPVLPSPIAEGRITLVNKEHGFVVLEFQNMAVPAAGTVLPVYRGDQGVGRVRITEPARGAFTSGDVLDGTLRRGDRVRPGDLSIQTPINT